MEKTIAPGWSDAERVFLALAAWREARGEGRNGMLAVMCSLRNRVNRPSWWGKTYAEVLFKKWQYSSLTDPKDPQLTKWPIPPDASFLLALQLADEVVHDRITSPVPGADSYYDISIPPPKWATPDKKVGQVGKIVFYNMDADHEQVQAAKGSVKEAHEI